MIIVTGAAGFIGSNMVSRLIYEGYRDIMLIDDFSNESKYPNFQDKAYNLNIDREGFIEWLDKNNKNVQLIIHLGARTDTTEFDKAVFDKLNLNYSKAIWHKCVEYGLPLIYASSAATYGMGEHGYVDNHEVVSKLKPLNPYGDSKNEFDKWALAQEKKPFFWAGLKFFNVFGPNEYHKGRMASVVYHAFHQIRKTGAMKLFKSHNPDYKDGEQIRDFIYVKDVVDVILFLMQERKHSGIYNLGTGKARTFLDLVRATFSAMDLDANISFVPTPEDIRDKYQYFTEADMTKLRSIGYTKNFHTLEEGVEDYVQNYLLFGKYN